jgi:hypothetical protein
VCCSSTGHASACRCSSLSAADSACCWAVWHGHVCRKGRLDVAAGDLSAVHGGWWMEQIRTRVWL